MGVLAHDLQKHFYLRTIMTIPPYVAGVSNIFRQTELRRPCPGPARHKPFVRVQRSFPLRDARVMKGIRAW